MAKSRRVKKFYVQVKAETALWSERSSHEDIASALVEAEALMLQYLCQHKYVDVRIGQWKKEK